MYGMVNRAVRDMVLARFGSEAWETIRTKATAPADFEKMQAYDDQVTYRLVGAASEFLRIPPADVMRTFGVYWVIETAATGYGPLLALWGNTLEQFLGNLDALHSRVAETFTALQPPSFRVVTHAPGDLEVHYTSHREGLAPFVMGLLEGVGQRFQTAVEIEHVASKAAGEDHDVFRVRYDAPERK